MSQEDYLLTIAEAAALLKVAKSWIFARTRVGTMPGMRRLGKYVRISRAELLAWVERQGNGHGAC